MRLRDIMSEVLETIPPYATVEEARDRMRHDDVRHLLVVEGEKLAGVLSDRDLHAVNGELAVKEVMTTRVVTATPNTTIREAANVMRGRRIGCLPLLDERQRLAGMVTVTDLLDLIGKGAVRVQPKTTKWVLAKRGPTHHPQPRR